VVIMTRRRYATSALCCLVVGLALAACSSSTALPAPLPTLGEEGLAAPEAVSTEPPTLAPESSWIQPGVPQTIADRVGPALAQAGFVPSDSADGATLRVVLNPGPDAVLAGEWIYVVAAPFPTVPDEVSWAGLQRYWLTGDAAALPGFETPPQVVVPASVADLLIAQVGPPAGGLPLNMGDAGGLVDIAWSVRPSISVLPFEALEPRWKILSLDGQSVLDKALNTTTYPLTIRVGVLAGSEAAVQAATMLQGSGAWQPTNRDPARLTNITMTGVTALVRATASQMVVKGVDFPAKQILPFLAEADILHTSNEVSFTPQCPAPKWEGPPLDFCSQPTHFSLLQTIGLDIVELTGNHNNDVGTAAFEYTLDLYKNGGIVYYGGGSDLEDALAPRVVLAPDGTRIAFVGCNSAGPYIAWATESSPGAAPCDDWTAITERIAALKANNEADVVIATLQYQERDSHEPSLQQITDFEQLAAAGADIVSGSQAHRPQGFSFTGGAFIHYGVGNLFFDQPELENRQMFADRHVFYAGRHISTVLFTGVIEYYSQPRPMTAEERAAFLELIFEASGW
jgi:hypothetical protein